jgi:PAS domain S-box-containing protein
VREPLISATFILDSDLLIIEAIGDAEVFLGCDKKDALNRPLPQVSVELDHMLKGIIEKAGRGRGVENYALAYKVGRRLVALRASAIPYPLAALGKTGILVTLISPEEKPQPLAEDSQEREVPVPLPGLAEEREVARVEDLAAFADPVFILDQGGGFAFANLPFQKLLDAGWDELRASHLSSWLTMDEPRKVVEQIIETVRLVPWRGELYLRTRAGREVVLSITFSLLKEGKKQSGGVLGCAKDFTELRRLEREKESEEARSWGLLERVPCSLFAFTPDERVTFWNREAERTFSLSTGRAAGMGLEEILGRENGERMRELIGRAPNAQGQVETSLRLVDRHERERILRVRAAVLDAGEGREAEYVAVAEDITETKVLQSNLRSMAGTLDFLARCIAVGVKAAAPEELLAGFLGEVEALTGVAAGAVYRIEDDYMELTSFRGYSEGFAKKAGRLRIRPNRMEVLETQSGLLLDLGGDPSPDNTTSIRIFFRDWDDYRQAHLEEGYLQYLFLPIKTEDAYLGMLVLAGFTTPQVDEEHLRAVIRALPWLGLAMRRPSVEEVSPPLFDDETRRRLAHELSTPLTYVRGFAQLLASERGQFDPEVLEEMIDNIDKGTARLVEIVGDYLPQPSSDE